MGKWQKLKQKENSEEISLFEWHDGDFSCIFSLVSKLSVLELYGLLF